MLASREAMMKRGGAARSAFQPFVSPVMRGRDPARHVRLRVTGVRKLWLIATGVPDNGHCYSDWGEARLIARDGKETRLCDLKPVSFWRSYGRLMLNRGHSGGPLQVGERRFKHGLGVHADSRICYALDGRYEWLDTWIGIDIAKGRRGLGHTRFAITDQPPRGGPSGHGLWPLLERDFPQPAARRHMAWERQDAIWDADWPPGDLGALAARYAQRIATPALAAKAKDLLPKAVDPATLHALRLLYYDDRTRREALERVKGFDFRALRLAMEDLSATFPGRYAKGPQYLKRLDALEKAIAAAASAEALARASTELLALREEALLANPLLDFGRLLLVKRRPFKGGRPGDPGAIGWDMGFPRSSAGNSALPRNCYDNEIAVLAPVRPDGTLTTLYRPDGHRFVGDVDLDFEADRLLFSMRDTRGRWQVHELRTDGTGLRQIGGDQPDVDNCDACYLPDGHILFTSSAVFQCVPCNGSHVEVLYRMDRDGRNVRQLGFEQDHDFNPCTLPTGRVLYLRWEYSDLPHANSRFLFTMNPDGTNQTAYYGASSYWPNSLFGARPIPGSPAKVVGIVAGHHGSHREGELVVFDTATARSEADGAVQRIPGRGKPVEPVVADQLTAGSWPKFAHPWPLSDKYFLVSCKLNARAPWELYLVDVFDNLLPLRRGAGYGLFEPIPLRKAPRPPVIPNRVDLARKDGVVYLADIYRGGGLRGVPRGTVKQLRLFTYHFAYQGRGGLLGTVGVDGPWDIKQVLGTVPVEPDGSAYFRVPANTPVSCQPLDAEGKALQLMRSWFVAMPGERVSCVGCHERQADGPPNLDAAALRRAPSAIAPWPGPLRGFSYPREVQPVVDRHCVRCHDGKPYSPSPREGAGGRALSQEKTPPSGAGRPSERPHPGPPPKGEGGSVTKGEGGSVRMGEGGTPLCDLRGTMLARDFRQTCPGHSGGVGGRSFSVGYVELCRYVRRPGIESDIHMLAPLEFHADTTELVQLLAKGHHGVALDPESWTRLITWIDLNAPYHGTWAETGIKLGNQPQRRRQLKKLYAALDEDPERFAGAKRRELRASSHEPRAASGEAVSGQHSALRTPHSALPTPHSALRTPHFPGWPFDAAEAQRRQAALGPIQRALDLGGGAKLRLVRIPAGEFLMGSRHGDADERPVARVRLGRPFWMGACEVSNEQFARFDPLHDSRHESKHGYQFGVTGYPVNGPRQPVVRVSWRRARAFCRWLSDRTGESVTLPTEAQWEWACRAGSADAFSFGPLDADYSKHANLADRKLRELASDPYKLYEPLRNPTKFDDWVPRDDRFHDGGLVSMPVGSYKPNPWGLHDMHGNVLEWTRSAYRPYPYSDAGALSAPRPSPLVARPSSLAPRPSPPEPRPSPPEPRTTPRVVRGGSWRDRPKRCRSAFRLAYRPWQGVYNVGFRVVCALEP